MTSEFAPVEPEPPSIRLKPARIQSEHALTVFRETRPIVLTRVQARPHLELTLHIRAVNNRRTLCNFSGRSPPRAHTMLRATDAELPQFSSRKSKGGCLITSIVISLDLGSAIDTRFYKFSHDHSHNHFTPFHVLCHSCTFRYSLYSDTKPQQ